MSFITNTRLRRGAILASLLVLGACAPDVSNWSGSDSPKQNQVDLVRLNHPVRFQPGTARLAQGEAEQLAAFLAKNRVGYGDRLVLQANGVPTGAGLATERQKAVAATMVRVGQVGLPITAASTADGLRDSLTVSVSRYVVTPPSCPDWSKPSGVDPANVAASNFGCATTRNLGLMLADPGDLIGGKTMGPADGEFAAGAVNRYRAGKITPLEGSAAQGANSTQGQGTNGQPGATTK